jgi:regulatory protein
VTVSLRTITRVEAQKRRPRRRSVYVNGEFAFGVDAEVAERFDLREGREIDGEALERIVLAEEIRKARDYSLDLLTIRARGERELSQRLKNKGYDSNVVERVVADLRRTGLLDDYQFALTWARDRMALRPRGIRLLRQELRARGIDPEIVARVLKEMKQSVDEGEVAARLVRRKMKSLTALPKTKVGARLFAYLARRGFDPETIRSAVRGVMKQEVQDD